MLCPINASAIKLDEETQIKYTDPLSAENTLYRNDSEAFEVSWQKVVAQTQSKVAQTHYGYCSCVTYQKAYYGLTQSIGFARNWPLNAKIGAVGGLIVLNIGKYGHVARIVAIGLNGYVVDEANYVRCSHTTGRVISFDDVTIKGFWNP